jgi:hypothetical protein
LLMFGVVHWLFSCVHGWTCFVLRKILTDDLPSAGH